MTPAEKASFLLTVDVEDWFQVENFKPYIPRESWPSRELRVERNTLGLLDLLDSVHRGHPSDSTRSTPVRATFFVLAWIAERLPGLVREIHARGHEVASHGCTHELCGNQSDSALTEDLVKSRQILEDIIGDRVFGFRAPSFSINLSVLEAIRKAGYVYDSSYNSFRLHGRYGHLPIPENGNNPLNRALIQPIHGLFELPISNLRLGNWILPWGGGAYFRLIPQRLFRSGIRFILKRQQAYVMYLHPWELDPDQPRVQEASSTRKFRHYTNLKKTRTRLKSLMAAFPRCDFVSCKSYIDQLKNAEPFNPSRNGGKGIH